MKRLIRDLRIIPVVVFAAMCLLALKLVGIALDGGYVLSGSDPAPGSVTVASMAAASSPSAKSWAQDMFGFPETTGSVSSKTAEKPAEADKKDAAGAVNPPKA